MSAETDIQENEFIDFFSESLPDVLNITNKDLSSRYISAVFDIYDDINIKNYQKSEESISLLKNSFFDENLQIETKYEIFKYINNTSEIKLSIDECEDYSPPINNGGILIPPVVSPIVPKPIITEYIFSGMNPDTKIFKIWTSTDINSKKPSGETKDYLHVGLIDSSKKAI